MIFGKIDSNFIMVASDAVFSSDMTGKQIVTRVALDLVTDKPAEDTTEDLFLGSVDELLVTL